MASCVFLAGSTQCPLFVSFSAYVNSPMADVAAFDAYIQDSVNTAASSGFGSYARSSSGLGCTGWDGTGLRDLQTALCAGLVALGNQFGPGGGSNCNPNPAPIPVCATTMAAFVASLDAVRGNATFCPNGGNKDALDAYESTFTMALAQMKDEAGCAAAQAPNDANCGFLTVAEALVHCATVPTDACCATVAGFTGATATAKATTAAAASSTTTTISAIVKAVTISSASFASSPTSSQQSASGSDNNNTISIPLVAGIAGGVAGLLIILLLMFCCRKRRASNEQGQFEDANKYHNFNDSHSNTKNAGFFAPAPVAMPLQNTQRRVVYSYRQNLSDELDCIAGDIVLVKNAFDDGWAMGFNARSKTEGYFPLEILEGYAHSNSANVFNKRGSSMYKQASMYDAGAAGQTQSIYSEYPVGAAGNTQSVYSEYQPEAAGGNTLSVYSEYQAGSDSAYIPKAASEPRKVLYAYDATQGDEISLQIGDLVAVQHEYDDGWGYARNLNTQHEGVIPMDCLAGFDGSEEAGGTKKNIRHSHRMSSILGAEMEKAFGSSASPPGLHAPSAFVPKPFASSNNPTFGK